MEEAAEAKQEEVPTFEAPSIPAEPSDIPPTPPATPPPPSILGEAKVPPPQETSPLKAALKLRRRPIMLVLGLLLLLLVGGMVVVFAAVAYQGVELPFVSKELSFTLQKTYAKLPLVPKAPRHILLKSLDSSLAIETFILDASMSMEDLDLALYGDAEVKEDTANFDVHLTAKSSSLTSPLTLEMDLISLGKILYFKIGTLTSPMLSAFIDLSPAIGKWWKYDLTTLETQARQELEKEQEEAAKTLTQQTQQKAIELFSQPEIIKAVRREKDETIANESSYHLHLSLTKEIFLKLMEALRDEALTELERQSLEGSFEVFEKLEIDLWIGKKTLVARKLKLLFKTQSSTSILGPSTAFEGVFVLELPKINPPVSITAPEGAQDVEELIQVLFNTQQPLIPDVLGEQTRRFLERE